MSDKQSSKRLQADLDAIEAFVASSAYSSYVKTHKDDLALCEQLILDGCPTDINSLFSLMSFYGRRSALQANLQFFEDARVGIKASIEATLDDENENANIKG